MLFVNCVRKQVIDEHYFRHAMEAGIQIFSCDKWTCNGTLLLMTGIPSVYYLFLHVAVFIYFLTFKSFIYIYIYINLGG